jgi:O-antigen/teichoic acid export membrane protein
MEDQAEPKMSLARRIATNTLWVSGARVLGKAASFVVILLLARYLGIEGFGKFAFVTAYLALFGFLTHMGLDVIVIREASRDLKGSESLVGNGIFLKTILACVIYAAALLVAWVSGYEPEKLLYIAIGGAGFFLAPLTLYTAAFFSTLELRLPSVLEIVARMLNLLFVVLVMVAGQGLAVIFAVIVLSGALEAFAKTYYARRRFRPKWRVDPAQWKYLIKEAWPLALVVIPTLLIQRIDQIMLEDMSGDAVLGYYSAAVRLTEAFLILPVAALSSLFPLLSRYYEQDPEAFERTSRLGFRYLSILGVAVPCFLAPLSGHAVTLLFGRPFAPAATPVIMLASTLIFLSGGFLLGSVYVVMGRQKALGLTISIAALLNVVLNWLWIPSQGATGAALATLLSYGFAMIAAGCYPPMLVHGRGFLGSLIKPVLVGILSLAVSFKLFAGHPLAVAFSFLALYACLLAVAGAFRREDWQLARRILSRSPKEEAS